jgi:hypothetical protein
MEVAHVERHGRQVTASGTQLGAGYELRYRLELQTLLLELVGERSAEIALGDADFFDLGWSPFFNSLPVIRDGLLHSETPRDYLMCWVDVPSLELRESRQRYGPLGDARVRFLSDSFSADIQFDSDGFVMSYPGIARRV